MLNSLLYTPLGTALDLTYTPIHLGGRSVRITRGSDDEGSDDDSGGSWRIVATAE